VFGRVSWHSQSGGGFGLGHTLWSNLKQESQTTHEKENGMFENHIS
jgi:hypothetical protein